METVAQLAREAKALSGKITHIGNTIHKLELTVEEGKKSLAASESPLSQRFDEEAGLKAQHAAKQSQLDAARDAQRNQHVEPIKTKSTEQ